MSRDRAALKKRNADIYQAYLELYNQKKNGVRVLNYAHIEMELAERFYLSTTTIGRIILEAEKNVD